MEEGFSGQLIWDKYISNLNSLKREQDLVQSESEISNSSSNLNYNNRSFQDQQNNSQPRQLGLTNMQIPKMLPINLMQNKDKSISTAPNMGQQTRQLGVNSKIIKMEQGNQQQNQQVEVTKEKVPRSQKRGQKIVMPKIKTQEITQKKMKNEPNLNALILPNKNELSNNLLNSNSSIDNQVFIQKSISIISLAKNLENMTSQLTKKLSDLSHKSQNTIQKVMNSFEHIITKNQIKNQNDYGQNSGNINQQEISSFIMSNQNLMQSIETQLQSQMGLVKSILDSKADIAKFQQDIQVTYQTLSTVSFTNQLSSYESIVKSLDNDIYLLKRIEEDAIDIVRFNKQQSSDEVQIQTIAQLQHNPQMIIVQDDLLISDTNVFSLSSNQIIQTLPDDPISGTILNDQLVVIGHASFARVKIFHKSNQGYNLKCESRVYPANGQLRAVQIQQIRINPYEDNDSSDPNIYIVNNKTLLSKVSLNLNNISEIKKVKLALRCTDFKFVDRYHLINQVDFDYQLINIESQTVLASFSCSQENFAILPTQFDIVRLPLLVQVTKESSLNQKQIKQFQENCKFSIADFMKHGFKNKFPNLNSLEQHMIGNESSSDCLALGQITLTNQNQIDERQFTYVLQINRDSMQMEVVQIILE